MKTINFFFIIIILLGCDQRSNNLNRLSDLIKPQYSKQQSFFSCSLLPNQTLSSIEMFIPSFVESFVKVGDSSEEIFFIFPIQNAEVETSKFKILLNHDENASIDKVNLTFAALQFFSIANCNTNIPTLSATNFLELLPTSNSTVIEILECEYLQNYNFATMKLVFDEVINEINKYDQKVGISYADNTLDNVNFRWINSFESIDSRKSFVELWQSSVTGKEIQAQLLEQSKCRGSEIYAAYKVL